MNFAKDIVEQAEKNYKKAIIACDPLRKHCTVYGETNEGYTDSSYAGVAAPLFGDFITDLYLYSRHSKVIKDVILMDYYEFEKETHRTPSKIEL